MGNLSALLGKSGKLGPGGQAAGGSAKSKYRNSFNQTMGKLIDENYQFLKNKISE